MLSKKENYLGIKNLLLVEDKNDRYKYPDLFFYGIRIPIHIAEESIYNIFLAQMTDKGEIGYSLPDYKAFNWAFCPSFNCFFRKDGSILNEIPNGVPRSPEVLLFWNWLQENSGVYIRYIYGACLTAQEEFNRTNWETNYTRLTSCLDKNGETVYHLENKTRGSVVVRIPAAPQKDMKTGAPVSVQSQIDYYQGYIRAAEEAIVSAVPNFKDIVRFCFSHTAFEETDRPPVLDIIIGEGEHIKLPVNDFTRRDDKVYLDPKHPLLTAVLNKITVNGYLPADRKMDWAPKEKYEPTEEEMELIKENDDRAISYVAKWRENNKKTKHQPQKPK